MSRVSILLAGACLLSTVACKSQLDGKQNAEVRDVAPKAAESKAADAAPAEPKAAEPNAAQAAPAEPKADAAPAAAGERKIQADKSEIAFVGAKVTGDHTGTFSKFSGTCKIEGDKPVGLSVQIDTTSLASDSERLTGHLKSPDFFDVEKFPTASFVATEFAAAADKPGTYKVTGDLELHGVKKSVSFDATIATQGDVTTGNTEFKINRKDFGIVYAGKAEDLIKDDVLLKLKLVCS